MASTTAGRYALVDLLSRIRGVPVEAGGKALTVAADFVEGRNRASRPSRTCVEIRPARAETSAGVGLRVDLSLARGLSYYTGAIMEINVPDLAGSLGGGGRYDNLVGMFLGPEHSRRAGSRWVSSGSWW